MEMKWEDPPEHAKRPGSGQKPGRYAKIASMLKQHPGKWAMIGESGSEKGAEGTANNIRRGKVRGFEIPEDSTAKYEVAVDGSKIYVRYVIQTEDQASDDDEPPRGDVRAWARSNGYPEVGKRGALPREVIDAYKAAH